MPARGLDRSSDAVPVPLVTGATGFLGGALACELLESDARVEPLFLVRAASPSEGVSRLRRNLARFGPSEQALRRVTERQVICGGLDDFARLADSRVPRITHIANCAALVSFSWNRDVWRTNVDETQAFAAAAALLPKLERFVHVSTALVSGSTSGRTVREAEFPGAARQFTLYTKSKAEIERRLPALLGASLVIARPSVIVGHSRIGCSASGSLFWLFRMIHAARRIPFPASRRIDIVPVDWCARALCRLLFRHDIAHACYHVAAGPRRSCSFGEIDEAFARAAGVPEQAPLQVFPIAALDDIAPDFERWFGACDVARTAAAIRVYTAFAGLDVTFDSSRLAAEGVAHPPRFTEYLHTCVRSAHRESISEQMAHDMR